MKDIIDEINAVHRETGSRTVPGGAEAKTIVMRRAYDAEIEDVWDAITTPDRINRWFLPVTGDFKVGGTYQFKGNAGGEILACEPPRLLRVTWIAGPQPEGAFSEVEVRLSPDGDEKTVLVLEHVATVPPDMWDEYGPGAVGTGWDGALLGLSLYLAGEGIDPSEAEAWIMSEEGRRFHTASAQAWGEALRAAGADPAAVEKAIRNTTAFYAPDPDES